jgi:DNA-binding GntR family transcriptional regulator
MSVPGRFDTIAGAPRAAGPSHPAGRLPRVSSAHMNRVPWLVNRVPWLDRVPSLDRVPWFNQVPWRSARPHDAGRGRKSTSGRIVDNRQSGYKADGRSAALDAVLKKSAEAQATDILRDRILRGALEPGARLTEIKLADALNVSRATLRTALHQLTVEGLVIQVPYTGWSVMTLTAHDAWELYTLRASLEGLAARLAAAALTADGRGKLEAAFNLLCDAALKGSLQKATAADFALHKTIVELSGHRRLAEQYRLVEQQVRVTIASTNALLPDKASIVDQHKPIVDAILAGDAAQAARCSEQHTISEGERLKDHLSRKEALST